MQQDYNIKITQVFPMNNRRQTTSFKNLSTTSPISTPQDCHTQCDQEMDNGSKRFHLPVHNSNRRFTRKNNNSHEKSASNLLKNTPGRPQKGGDRSLASVVSQNKIIKENNPYTSDSPSPSTVSTVKGHNTLQTAHIISNNSYVNLTTMVKNRQRMHTTSSIDLFGRNSLGSGGSFRLPKTKQNKSIESPNLSTAKNMYSRSNLLIQNSQKISQENCGSRYSSSNSKSFSLESYKNSSSAADSRIRREKQNSSQGKAKKSTNIINLKKNSQKMVQNKNSCYMGNVAILETELELKEKEIEKLVSENEKLHKNFEEIKVNQQKMKKKIEQSKYQSQQLCKKLNEQQKKFENYDKKMNEEIKKLKIDIEMGKRQLGIIKRDKQIAEKQLNTLMDRKIPKNIRQIQTCRQISQQKTIQQLKWEISRSKTEVQKQMQQVINNLRRQTMSLQEELRSLQIVNRLMSKKSTDSDRYLEAYTAMKNQNKNAKILIKQLSDECEYLRKQNIRMKKQIKKISNIGSYNGKSGKTTQRINKQDKTTLQIPSDNDSLNLSISVMSK